MQCVIDVLTARRINANHIDSPQVNAIGEFLWRYGELFSLRRQTSISSLAELSYLNIVLKQNSVSLCPVVADNADYLNEVTEWVLGIGWPLVEGNDDSFILQLCDLVGPDVEVGVFVVSWDELVDIECLAFFSFCLHLTAH